MKQFLISCFLMLRLSQYHASNVGGEFLGWIDHSVDFMLPVNCKTMEKINLRDDYLQSKWMRVIARGDPKGWKMEVVRKIVKEDGIPEFDCF